MDGGFTGKITVIVAKKAHRNQYSSDKLWTRGRTGKNEQNCIFISIIRSEKRWKNFSIPYSSSPANIKWKKWFILLVFFISVVLKGFTSYLFISCENHDSLYSINYKRSVFWSLNKRKKRMYFHLCSWVKAVISHLILL